MAPKVFQLSGTCNNYPWGKKGKHSLAAQLCQRTRKDFDIKDDQFYSEMWFGDYPNYPARVLPTGELLSDVLQKNKEELLGKKVVEELDGQLPIPPKGMLPVVHPDIKLPVFSITQILSIEKALPLQLHPSKELAAKLHQKDPDNFTDPNHKPEIAVALSKFEVFAGFKPLDEVAKVFQIPVLQQFRPKSASTWTDAILREVTRNILKADETTVKRVQEALLQTPKANFGKDSLYIPELLPRLQKQYGAQDPGTLVALLCMNFFIFGPGDAIYIPADGIHAYLSGNIVECMARSNNVLNAGFCPPADRNNLDLFTDTLTFKSHGRDDVVLPSQKSERSKAGRTVVYRPPIREFDMLRADLKGNSYDELSGSEGPGVMIVTQGHGTMKADGKTFELTEGFIFFVAPRVSIKWETETGMQIFMAAV